jgi:hypothetical protein
VYAGCLDWNESGSKWNRPTAIEVSIYGKQWAFPTTVDENSSAIEGSELDGYAVTGSEIRGFVARNSEKYVWLDNEFFMLRGDYPITGWQFIRLDSVGCISNRTIADCRGMFIWCDGSEFYSWAGGRSEPISRHRVDVSLIDWTKAHNAVYCDDKYVCFCNYDAEWALVVYDLLTGAWTVRRSDALELTGICTDGLHVYGVTPAGDAVDVWGSTTADYGASSTVRELWTQYVILSNPGEEVHVKSLKLDIVAGTAVDLDLVIGVHGTLNTTSTRKLAVATNKTRYDVNLNLKCDSLQVKLTYTGSTPPTIHFVGVEYDEVAAR